MKSPLIGLLLCLAVPTLSLGTGRNRPFVRPPFLQEGDTVGIVATSSMIPAKADTAKVRAFFTGLGLHVKFGCRSFASDSVAYTLTDEGRAADFQAMIDDPGIRAILPFRGGYGAVRILDKIDMSRLHAHPKWIAGYSDVTALHLALGKAGIESIHSTMPGNFRYDTVDVAAFSLRDALFGRLPRQIELPPHPYNSHGTAQGRLAGGNLSLIHAAACTPEDIDTHEPVVLLIEDVGEDAYRIDRMMQHLKRSGKLHSVQAILVGYFTRITQIENFDPEGDIFHLIRSYTEPLGIPVLFGVPAGHEQPNLALYMGRRVYVEAGEEGAVIRFE